MSRRKSHKLMTLIAGASLAAVAAAGAAQATTAPAASGGGGELIDLGTFALGPPEHIDPTLNTTLDAQQVGNALYDALTDIDSSDPTSLKVVPDLADFSSNEDATVWTFTIHPDQAFSDGEPILPSTFQRSWERASDPEVAGDYAALFNYIQGGAEKLDGTADTISGVVADDDAMTLTVTLSAPYSSFAMLAGFQLFAPMPEAAVEAGRDYENQLMIGNGPYAMESARSDEEIVLVKNDNWDGDWSGNTWDQRPDRIVFAVSSDADTSYSGLEAGEGDTARIPSGRTAEAVANWGTTTDTTVMGSYYFQFKMDDPRVGGPENLKLRQAISQAIDRDAINDAIYDGARTVATGIVSPGIPGFKPDLCEYCAYDPDAAKAAFDEWTAAGNVQDGPLPIQFGSGGVHGDLVQLIIDNLAAVGIEAVPDERDTTTYFSALSDGACVFCRTGWIADFPAYDNFLFNLFVTGSGNNYGYSSPEFDALVAQANSTVDATEQATLFNQAEEMLLNQDIGAVPVVFYTGDYAFNADRLQGFHQTPLMSIPWEQIILTDS